MLSRVIAPTLPLFSLTSRRRISVGFLLALTGLSTAFADALKFPDGEVVKGTFIRRENGEIVFQSKNLGIVRVAEDKVLLEIENVMPMTTAPVADQRTSDETPEVASGEDARPTSIFRPRAALKKISRKMEREFVNWWEPWKGRLAASLNIINDVSERSEYLVEGRASRDWPSDAVTIESRYEYRKVNAELTTDQIRSIGSWRHDLSNRYFTQYRPEAIRDRINASGTQPFPYFMLRQQLGIGIHLLRKQEKAFRVGVAHEFFNVWALKDHQGSSEQANSAFFEGEMNLPWRMSAKDRLVWHFTGGNDDEGFGWEHEFELTKKFTDSLSFGVRQEFRANNPDSRVTDSERLRFLFTYDF